MRRKAKPQPHIVLDIGSVIRKLISHILSIKQANAEVPREEEIQTTARFDCKGTRARSRRPSGRVNPIEAMHIAKESLTEYLQTARGGNGCVAGPCVKCVPRATCELDLVHIHSRSYIPRMPAAETNGQ